MCTSFDHVTAGGHWQADGVSCHEAQHLFSGPSKTDVQTAAIRAWCKTLECTGDDLLALLGLVRDPADPLAVGVQRFEVGAWPLGLGCIVAPAAKVFDQEHWRRTPSRLTERIVTPPLQDAPPPRQDNDEGEMTARSQMSAETSHLSEGHSTDIPRSQFPSREPPSIHSHGKNDVATWA